MTLDEVQALERRVRDEIHKVIVGADAAIDLMLIALLARGHVLLEGVPGTAKTLMARSLAAALRLGFGRIQFTPDLMPGDVLGTSLFNFQTNEFTLTKGPIFTEFLLADEINRAPPKTQSALLEAMQERKVTIEDESHELGPGFMVVATQNPIEHQGTYPLPEAQLDRFLFKIVIGYPSREDECAIVDRHGHGTVMPEIDRFAVGEVADLAAIEAARAAIAAIRLNDDIVGYIVDLMRATRSHPALDFGASPRAATMLAASARARAAVDGRDYVLPDDVKELLPHVLRHRLVLSPTAEIEGLNAEGVVAQIIETSTAPR
jgi:MoxR-like ATPase